MDDYSLSFMTPSQICVFLKAPVDPKKHELYLLKQFVNTSNEANKLTTEFVDEIIRLKKAYPDVPGGTFLTYM